MRTKWKLGLIAGMTILAMWACNLPGRIAAVRQHLE